MTISSSEHAAPLVLLVDDEADVCLLLRMELERLRGLRTVRAQDGVAALAILQATPVDLVILDGPMPRMDGNEVLRTMKADPRWRDIPVITTGCVDDAYWGGEDDQHLSGVVHRPLPFAPAELSGLVDSLLAS